MRDAFAPVLKQSLSDKLAQRIRAHDSEGRLSAGRPPAADHGDGASASASATRRFAKRSRSSRRWASSKFAMARAST